MSSAVAPILPDPVFDRCWWVYSLCRERLFADHTDAIAAALDPLFRNQTNPRLLEVGCGPGFYSRRLAARYPLLQTLGIDTSERLLSRAREQATRAKLSNCSFLHADAHHLPDYLEVADAAIASRFFLILPERTQVLRSIFETLRPGGLFFVAEPRSALRTAVPLWMMRTVDLFSGRPSCVCPVQCEVLTHQHFHQLIGSQPWGNIRFWSDRRYQYALCEKAS